MSDTTTPNYGFDLPAVGASQDTWGGKLNANWTLADSAIHGLASGYLPLSGGGTINGHVGVIGNLDVTGNIGVGGALSANSVYAATGITGATASIGGALSAGTGTFVGALRDNAGRIISQNNGGAPSVTCWDTGAGYAGGMWAGPGKLYFGAIDGNGVPALAYGSFDNSSNLVINGSLYCQSSGVHYTNICPNGFNFRWDSSNFFMRVDNAVEIAVQPQSDERLKGDIAPSTFDCLAAVLATPLFQFRWKTLGQTPDLATATVARDAPLVPIGFVAQRQQAVFPASVIPGGDTGRSAGGATTMWQMDHNALCAALFGAIQQLTARVADLEALRLA